MPFEQERVIAFLRFIGFGARGVEIAVGGSKRTAVAAVEFPTVKRTAYHQAALGGQTEIRAYLHLAAEALPVRGACAFFDLGVVVSKLRVVAPETGAGGTARRTPVAVVEIHIGEQRYLFEPEVEVRAQAVAVGGGGGSVHAAVHSGFLAFFGNDVDDARGTFGIVFGRRIRDNLDIGDVVGRNLFQPQAGKCGGAPVDKHGHTLAAFHRNVAFFIHADRGHVLQHIHGRTAVAHQALFHIDHLFVEAVFDGAFLSGNGNGFQKLRGGLHVNRAGIQVRFGRREAEHRAGDGRKPHRGKGGLQRTVQRQVVDTEKARSVGNRASDQFMCSGVLYHHVDEFQRCIRSIFKNGT